MNPKVREYPMKGWGEKQRRKGRKGQGEEEGLAENKKRKKWEKTKKTDEKRKKMRRI